ncbi:MAG: respiratory nitrate reductase subunit gamma [Chloroflexi bacterium]|nr:respiratory nitrate reductase subunit gamma [Chloroflexota bacterium]
MALFLYLAPLTCLALFVLVVGVRVVRIASLPVHLRWELYPVAHEKGAGHGGSYFEQVDWWAKPRAVTRLGELKEMLGEMLLLKALYHHNRALWTCSFPFHFGLYTLAAFGGLLGLGALAQLGGLAVTAGGGNLGQILYFLPIPAGFLGLALALIGATGLLRRRLTDPSLRDYTTASDVFNLLCFLVTFGVVLAAALTDPTFTLFRDFLTSLLTFSAAPAGTALVWLAVLMATLLLAYIPMTHMAHFFTKWFTWHSVRWDDEPNLPGSRIEAQVKKALQYPVSWSAPHIQGDGRKTWVDVATEEIK